MEQENLPQSFHRDFTNLEGTTLAEIKIGMHHVDFLFVFESSYILRMKKEFEFYLPGNQGSQVFSIGDIAAVAGSGFIFLQGRTCRVATSDNRSARVTFTDGASLSVTFGPADFEPLEFIGYQVGQPEVFTFYYVL